MRALMLILVPIINVPMFILYNILPILQYLIDKSVNYNNVFYYI